MKMKTLNWITEMKSLTWLGITFMFFVTGLVYAAPNTILFEDHFERSNPGTVGNSWVVTPVANVGGGGIDCTGTTGNTGCAGIDSDVPPWNVAAKPRANLTKSMFTRWNGVQVTTPTINAAVPAVQVEYWLRRGSDCFSEWPGNQSTGCTYTATITVTGAGSTSVDGITINGVQIMSGPSTAANSNNAVATNIVAKINVAGSGFTASRNGSIVTITGANMNAYGDLPIISQNGLMTLTIGTPNYNPNYGEEFQVQYLNNANTWVNLKKYPAEGPPGQIYHPVIELPGDALWSGLKIRFYQPSGSGSQACNTNCAPGVRGYDYWHIDDVVVTELAAANYTGTFCDNFEGGQSRWTVTGFGDASQGSKYFQNGAHDMDIRWDSVTVTSKPHKMTTATGDISFWVKRGIGTGSVPNLSGSDIPENNKNLVFQYLTKANTWTTLATFNGGGTGGQIFCPVVGPNCPVATPLTNSFPLSSLVNPNLDAFQFRFSLVGTGTGYDFDYWHVDDLCIGAVAQPTDLSMTISPTGTTQVNPGATAVITLVVTNNGPNVEPGDITIIDNLPAGLSLDSTTASTWSDGSMLPGATNACSANGLKITCTRVGSLAVSLSTTLFLRVKADPTAAGSGLLNTAIVAGQSNDTNLINNEAHNFYSFDQSPFNAYETSTAANSVSGQIYTKLVGTAFSLNAVAISAGAIKTNYAATMTVDLIDGAATCATATALAGVTVSSTLVAPYSYTPYLYTTGTGKDNGIHTFLFTVSNPYRNVKVRMTDTNGAKACSSDSFAIRPTVFTVSSTNATAAGTNKFRAATVAATGASFNLSAASVVGYDGVPLIDNTKLVGSSVAGAISGSFNAAPVATGTASGAGFTYSEVGYFGLNADAVYDSTFTAVDQSVDCVALSANNTLTVSPATPVGQYGCNIGSTAIPLASGFGRFVPDHFDTTVTAPMTCAGLTFATPCASGLVYSGQVFSTVTVAAMNASYILTKNYTGTVNLTAVDALGGVALAASVGSLGGTTTVTGFANGTATLTGSLAANTGSPKFIFTTTPTLPTNVFIRATESTGDGVTSLRATASASVEGGLKVVSGQVKITNAYGSELLPLTLTATVQYYSTNGWVRSLTDNVTSLTLAATYPLVKNGVTSGNTTTPAPTGAANVGGGRLSIALGKPTGGGTGTATVNPTAPTYLPITSGAATFGVYKGSNEFIYLREAY
jgi:hypothetical protein